ncbi:hypothetical protein AB0G74_21675 [Streptomyces sp. NPDC020875]|uniref:hypothetical protein n=1 Tax=Streptomyces sp. NPDC020875 TaxID=3154898 RepID=UPI0033FDF7D1
MTQRDDEHRRADGPEPEPSPPAADERAWPPCRCGNDICPDRPGRRTPPGPIVTVPVTPFMRAAIDRITAAARAGKGTR